MITRIYKFKSANKQNIEALLQNKLWVSNLYKMNDPMDLAIYIDKDYVGQEYRDEDVVDFHTLLTKCIYCASFTTIYSNRRLWNYYSDGFCGFVVGYTPGDIEKCLNELNLRFAHHLVEYTGKSYDFSKSFKIWLESSREDKETDMNAFFTKDKSWEEEKEYRFSITECFDWNKTNGGMLCNLLPRVIYIGYKMNKEYKKAIMDYCISNRIPLKVYMPKFDSKTLEYKFLPLLDFKK